MKMVKLYFLLPLIACMMPAAAASMQATKADTVENVLQERDRGMYAHATLLGELKFLGADGKPGASARSITVNGKPLVTIGDEKDAQGSPWSLMNEDLKSSSTEYEPTRPGQAGASRVRRMVVLLGPVANCVKQFIILDFTGKDAFVSNRFGYNPDDKSCLAFKRAKWGNMESTITLEGPMTYIYYTKGKVVGPM